MGLDGRMGRAASIGGLGATGRWMQTDGGAWDAGETDGTWDLAARCDLGLGGMGRLGLGA